MEHIKINISDSRSEPINNISSIIPLHTTNNDIDVTNSLSYESNFNNEQQQQQQGGFIWFSGGKTKIDKVILSAAKDNKFETVNYMIMNNLMSNYSATDSNGYTVLHYLAMNYDKCQCNSQTVDIILKSPKVKSFINIQDKIHKNTPLHMAVKKNYNTMADKLVEKGADKNIKNIEGEHIDSESCSTIGQPFDKIPSKKETFILDTDLQQDIQKIVDKFIKRPKDNQVIYTESINMPSDLFDTINLESSKQEVVNKDAQTEKFLDEYVKNLEDVKSNNNTDVNQVNQKEGGYDTEILYKEIMDKYIKKDNMNGGRCPIIDENEDSFGSYEDDNKSGGYTKPLSINKIRELLIRNKSDANFSPYTDGYDKFVLSSENKMNTIPSQSGGKNKKRSGKRKLKMNEEESDNRPSELYRLLNKQTDNIRKRVLEKIMDIMGVDEETAIYYRAALWKKIKEEHPEMKTNMEKHVEMEKITTKKVLSKIPKEQIKEIEKYIKEKKSKNKTKKQPIAESDYFSSESSETSHVSVPHMNYISETSSEFSHNVELNDDATSDNSIESLYDLSETSLE